MPPARASGPIPLIGSPTTSGASTDFPWADGQGICLERSLLAYRFLSGAGARPDLVVGVRPGGEGMIGHAWVVVGGEPLFEPAASLSEYVSFFSFGRGGALDTSLGGGMAHEAVAG